jgi:hypothetical protein
MQQTQRRYTVIMLIVMFMISWVAIPSDNASATSNSNNLRGWWGSTYNTYHGRIVNWGARANLSLRNPYVNPSGTNASSLWITSGFASTTVGAGWMKSQYYCGTSTSPKPAYTQWQNFYSPRLTVCMTTSNWIVTDGGTAYVEFNGNNNYWSMGYNGNIMSSVYGPSWNFLEAYYWEAFGEVRTDDSTIQMGGPSSSNRAYIDWPNWKPDKYSSPSSWHCINAVPQGDMDASGSQTLTYPWASTAPKHGNCWFFDVFTTR